MSPNLFLHLGCRDYLSACDDFTVFSLALSLVRVMGDVPPLFLRVVLLSCPFLELSHILLLTRYVRLCQQAVSSSRHRQWAYLAWKLCFCDISAMTSSRVFSEYKRHSRLLCRSHASSDGRVDMLRGEANEGDEVFIGYIKGSEKQGIKAPRLGLVCSCMKERWLREGFLFGLTHRINRCSRGLRHLDFSVPETRSTGII